MQPYNVIYPVQVSGLPATAANAQYNPPKLLASSTFSLVAIGVGSIIFGCADLVAGFMAFSFMWGWAWLFTYAWAGFLFAIVSGSLCLKAASIKPHVDKHWTNVTFGFGIATLILHVVDAAIVLTSFVTLTMYDYYELYRDGPYKESSGVYYGRIIYTNYYYQSPLTAEAPRLVIVSVLLALDIWLLVVTSKLRDHFSKHPTNMATAFFIASPSAVPPTGVAPSYASLFPTAADVSEPNKANPDTLQVPAQVQVQVQVQQSSGTNQTAGQIKDLQLLARGQEALLACGAFSIAYGVIEFAFGWWSFYVLNRFFGYNLKWFILGFSLLSFALAVVSGILAVRGAFKKPNVGAKWSLVLIIFGVLSLVSYLVCLGFSIYTLPTYGQARPTYRSTTYGELTNERYNWIYYVYYRAITPAVPEAARLVVFFLLICVAIVQIIYARKLRTLFISNPTITLAQTPNAPTSAPAAAAAPVSVYPYPSMPVTVAGYYPPQANTGFVLTPGYAPGYNVTYNVNPTNPAGQPAVVSSL